MHPNEYHERIIQYYTESENAYKDSWDLNNSMAIHYGYWDTEVKSFPQSLIRMNEVMMKAANIESTDRVLDAGCGVGGSSIFLASVTGCKVTGITLSERQMQKAFFNAKKCAVNQLVDFKVMDFSKTDFPDASFNVVWGCESICYADNKEHFIQEAYRLLKPGGRLVVADGFVTAYENNDNLLIRQWLDGWQVNYLESPARFKNFLNDAGFKEISYKNISNETKHSSKRLNHFYYLASLYLLWKKINFSKPATELQKKNIKACRFQYRAMRKGLWQYGLVTGKKEEMIRK